MPPPKKTKPAANTAAPATPAPAPAAAAPQRSEVKGSGTAAKTPAAPREITYQMIEQRAYEIYASRGYAPGDPVADWLEAERQLKAGL
jgi:hypothetical protein